MVNPRLILYLVGWITLLTGGTFIFPIICSFIYEEEVLVNFFEAAIVSLLFGGLLMSLGYSARHQETRYRDSLAVVGISWFLISCIGALPYWFSGNLDVWGAAFESFSGFSSTGATNISDLSSYPKGLLFWRCFSQYLGGMGIVVLMVAVLPFLGVGGQLLLKNELSGLSHDKLKPRVAQIAKTLWMVYLSFTVVLLFLYLLSGEKFFDSLCLTFSTLSTGGFANWNNSIGHYNGYYVPIVTIVFMYLGSISFAIHYQVFTGNPRSFFLNL
ncbi:MAG: hypothetical protein LBE38_00615 [Deltaproteobacteria bacterium]|jgi:trk system potassium uptake protein TrkH|nr:hypothetical protein [Deltaproteobacteria bacterium]